MSLSLQIICPSTGGHEEAVETWRMTASQALDITIDAEVTGESAGFLSKCEKFRKSATGDVIGFLHSDLFVHEMRWNERVMCEFTKPDVAVVGFLGARRLGHPDLYKVPYSLSQLARYGVVSNFTDWRIHGEREEGSSAVAVIDSCAVFVRRSFLDHVGGWPVGRYPDNPHCSDLWLSCMARRAGYKTMALGVMATHRSGGKGEAGSRWLEQHGGDQAHHQKAHELIYSDFCDVLPFEVGG